MLKYVHMQNNYIHVNMQQILKSGQFVAMIWYGTALPSLCQQTKSIKELAKTLHSETPVLNS
jgi:hypothetical protein